jgi:hypothetical protein
MQVQLILTGEQTAAFPEGRLLGDLKLYRASPLFGPFTPFQFSLEVLPEITV